MKPAKHPHYKKLYLAALEQNAAKDALIAVMQKQMQQLADDRQYYLQINIVNAQQLQQQSVQINQQQHTILGQAEKLTQQQTIINQQSDRINIQQKELDKNSAVQAEVDRLRYELKRVNKMIYGIKSEKRHYPSGGDKPASGQQLALDMEVDRWGVCQITARRRVPAHTRIVKSIDPVKRGGRHALPPGLEEQITVVDPPNKPKDAKCVGYEDQRQLACDPMRWYIKVTRRLVYLVPKDEDHLNYKQLIAPLPAHPIARCKMDISILVMLTIEKFLYHMPLWRQEQRLRSYGIQLPYSTICHLVNRTCEALEPLWHLLLKEIIASGLMSMDETRYRVLDSSKKEGKKSHIGWMWSCLNPAQGIVCFLYQQGRGKKDIQHVLQGYRGILMTDAYGAYTKYGRQPGVTHQHCLSHARRLFVYALDHDGKRAVYALDNFFGPLYDIEQECKSLELDYDGITVKRQTESLSILESLREWVQSQLSQTIPRTPIYKALQYTLKNYNALVKYTMDGIMPVDNNQLEGQIRSIALGRNAYMFAGSHRGGQLAAIIYSFMGTCKLQHIDPARWLDDVLRRIGSQPEKKLHELLPQFWKPLSSAAQASA
jgi:transposase